MISRREFLSNAFESLSYREQLGRFDPTKPVQRRDSPTESPNCKGSLTGGDNERFRLDFATSTD